MLRKILISVGELAQTVSDIKEEVRTLKDENKLVHELEPKARKDQLEAKVRISETATKPNRVKLPKMLQGKKQQVPPDFIIGDIVRLILYPVALKYDPALVLPLGIVGAQSCPLAMQRWSR